MYYNTCWAGYLCLVYTDLQDVLTAIIHVGEVVGHLRHCCGPQVYTGLQDVLTAIYIYRGGSRTPVSLLWATSVH